MTYFKVQDQRVTQFRKNAAGDTEECIVDLADAPVAARILDLCQHYDLSTVTCNPDAGYGSIARCRLRLSWDGDDVVMNLPNVGPLDDADHEGAAETLVTWLEVAAEMERLFKRFDDPSVLGTPALAVTFDGDKIKVLAYRGPVILAEYVSVKSGWFKASECLLSDRLSDWAETLIAKLRGEDVASLSQISVREGYEALYLAGWGRSVDVNDLPAAFPGRPALRVVRQGLADLTRELTSKEPA